MREYRGIEIGGTEFIYGWYCEVQGRHYLIQQDAFRGRGNGIFSYIEVIPETVGQQIGLKDKDEVEMYVGSIYKWHQPLVENGKQITKEHFSAVEDSIPVLFYLNNRVEGGWGGVEVVGNIHEKHNFVLD